MNDNSRAGVDPRTPNLFVIGAPKCGTTVLHHALSHAPDVYMSTVKEPGFFTSERGQRWGLDWYLDAFFADAGHAQIRGESTPWYLYSEMACELIAGLGRSDSPKAVAVLRRPSRRALSMYHDQLRLRREDRTFEAAVEEEISGLDRDRRHPDLRRRYVWCGLYAPHLLRWRQELGPENVHVQIFEEMVADEAGAWAELSAFLGVDLGPSRFGQVEERDRNPQGDLRWPRLDRLLRSFEGRDIPAVDRITRSLPPGLHRRVLQRISRFNRSTATRDEYVDSGAGDHRAVLERLDRYFRSEVDRLEDLLDRPLDVWRADPDTASDSARTPAEHREPTNDRADRGPIRLLHLVARSHHRGAELVAVELADELDQHGLRNEVMALGAAVTGGQERGLEPLVPTSGIGPVDLVRRAYLVRRVLADERFDVVLAHGGWAAQVVALATIGQRDRPLLVWQRILHFPDGLWRFGRRSWWRGVASRYDGAVALTEDLRDELRTLGFSGPVWVIPNFRKPGRFMSVDRDEAERRLREEIDVRDDRILVGFVGHLVDQKRPERVLEAVARARERRCAVHLVLAGDGPLGPWLRSEAERLGVADDVTFLGHRADVEHVYGAVAATLLTSDAEGIPGVAIESLMTGCPVITYPVGGVAEVVDDGETGIVLDRPDVSLLADALVELLEDEPRRRAMSRAARSQAERFKASETAAVYADHFVSQLANR